MVNQYARVLERRGVADRDALGPTGASIPERVADEFSVNHGIYATRWHGPEFVLIEFDRLRYERSAVIGIASVSSQRPNDRGRVLHRAAFNLSGPDSRSKLARELQKRRPGVPWAAFVEEATQRSWAAFEEGEPVLDLSLSAEQPVVRDLLPGLVPASGVTIFFGDGGVAKSTLMLALCATIHSGRADLIGVEPTARRRVLFLDWEDEAAVHQDRLGRLAGNERIDIRYRRMAGPMADQLDSLRRIVRDEEVGLVAVDSIAPAAGGEPESAQVAMNWFEAARTLAVPIVASAHTTKAGDDTKPFGSAFWHNLARCTWFIKKQRAEVGSDLRLALVNRKNNRGSLQADRAYVISHGARRLRIYRDLAPTPISRAQDPLRFQMRDALRAGPLTYEELASSIGANRDSVRKTASRYVGKLFRLLSVEGITKVALRDP